MNRATSTIVKSIPEATYVTLNNGITLHYHDLGDKKNPIVVFLHGSGPGASSWSNFRDNKDYFLDNVYRVILLDLPGYGYSDKPSDIQYSTEFYQNSVTEFLDITNIKKLSLVGNSLGGSIAIQVALAKPECVENLILLAPGFLKEFSELIEMPGIKAMFSCIIDSDEVTLDGMRTVFEKQLYDSSELDEGLLKERLVIAKEQPKAIYTTLSGRNLTDELHKIQCPTLTFWGSNDLFCPSSSAPVIAEKVENSTVVMVNKCGHWVQVERPSLFNKVSVDFLKKSI